MQHKKAIIIDDSVFITTVLADMLRENHPEIDLRGLANSGAEGLELIAKEKPDLVFLDVEMPGMSGFELLLNVPAITFKTIFITAHDHYAIQAIRFNALDYLVKPLKPKELAHALHRFWQTDAGSANQTHLKLALDNLKEENPQNQTLQLRTQEGEINLRLRQIIFIEGDRNYSNIRLADGNKKLVAKSMIHFEQILADKGFFRCHRSFMVNGYHIANLKDSAFLLNSGHKIAISRRKLIEAKNWLHENAQWLKKS